MQSWQEATAFAELAGGLDMRKFSKTGVALIGTMIVCAIIVIAIGVPNGFFGGDDGAGDMNDDKTPGVKQVMDGQTPLFMYDRSEAAITLMDAMDKGEVVSVSLLYDQMGANSPVESKDSDVIREAYRALKNIVVIDGGSDGQGNVMDVTDSYHYVYFTLKNGSEIGYRFEGEEAILIPDGTATGDLQAIDGSAELWDVYWKLAK